MNDEKNGTETTTASAQATAKALAVIPVVDSSPLACWFDSALFAQTQRAAALLCKTDLIPARYKDRQADCFVAIAMARRLEMEPLAVMPDLYVVHGTPGMSGKLVIALINKSGQFKGKLRFRFDGSKPPAWCEAFAVEKETGEELSVRVTWEDVVNNGWNREGSKWRSMREQMFRYRAAAWFSRAYCPEVGFGLLTVDEIEDDMSPAAKASRVVAVTVEKADGGGNGKTKDKMTEAAERLAAMYPTEPPDPEPAPEPKKRGRGHVIDKTARLTPEELTGLEHAIETSNKLAETQSISDYIEQVLGLAVPLENLTKQQAEAVLNSLK